MIPRFIHQVWIGPDPCPAEFANWGIRWHVLHGGWGYRLWTNDALAEFPLRNQPLWDAAPDIVPGHEWQFRSDLARYEILAEYGGVYVDLDMEPLRPIDDLVAGVGDAFTVWETDNVWANNAVMGATHGHPWLIDLVGGLPAWIAEHPGKRPNVLSGPQYLTPRLTLDVTVLPSRLFYPYLWSDVGTRRERGPFPDAYAVHHWNNTRKARAGRKVPRGMASPMSVTTTRRPRRGR